MNLHKPILFTQLIYKRIAFPHTPCDSFVLILISIYILLVIIKDYFSLHLPAKPAIFDLSRSSPKIS